MGVRRSLELDTLSMEQGPKGREILLSAVPSTSDEQNQESEEGGTYRECGYTLAFTVPFHSIGKRVFRGSR